MRINPTTRLEDFLKVEEELVFWHNADRALFELFEQGMEWAGKKGEWSTLCAHGPSPTPRAAALWLCCPDLCCLPSSHPRTHATAHTTPACAARRPWPFAICSL